MSANLDALFERIGYRFRQPGLLTRALTHKSRIAEKSQVDPTRDNEQFEFLGDAILGFVISEALVLRFPAYPEGKLSKLKAWLVSATHLHAIAESLNLGEYLLLGRGEEMSGGREKRALLSNAVEAIIAAVYLDGGMDPARALIENRVLDFAGDLVQDLPPGVTNFKSVLQERAQALKLPQPKYAIVSERGPEHAKTFTVEVRLGKTLAARGEGISKKEAGQRAAALLMEQLASPSAQLS